MINSLFTHRSVRKYKDKLIPDTILSRIFEAGCRASTTGNMQLYSIINTTDKLVKEQLLPCHFNQQMIVNAPNVLTFCADFNRFKQWCELSNAQAGYDNFLSFFTAAIDALLVAQNIAIAAEEEGLGICYIGTTTYNADKIIDVLQLPKNVVPVTTLTIGWPDEQPDMTDRLPLESIVHSNVYKNYNEQNIIDAYKLKENLEQNKGFVKDNGKETLAQVFTDVRYKKDDNEFFSMKFIEVLKNQGFLQH